MRGVSAEMVIIVSLGDKYTAYKGFRQPINAFRVYMIHKTQNRKTKHAQDDFGVF